MFKPKNVKFFDGDKQLYQQFQIHRQIGNSNNYVYEVINKQGQIQCVKILEDKMQEFNRQINLLQKLTLHPHKNIVEFKGSYVLIEKSTQGKSVKKGYIQMQRGLTNLKTHINKRQTPFNEQQLTDFFISMLDVFAHLQKIQVAHRDIKPHNILVFDQNPLLCKICDIGAGAEVSEYENTKERTVIGTDIYLSPELYLAAYVDRIGLTNYNAYKSDVYSLGLLFIEFCLLSPIKSRLKNEQAQIKQKIIQIKQRYPNIIGLGKVLRNMLEKQPSKRMDFLQLKQFISQHNLLRNKLNKTITLSPKLSEKLYSRQQITIDCIDQFRQLSAIVSTNSTINSLKIHIQTNINALKPNQRQMLDQLAMIRHMKLHQLHINIEVCEIDDKHLKMIADALEKNNNLTKLFLNFWNNQITNVGFISLLKSINKNLLHLQQLKLFFPSNQLRVDQTYLNYFNFPQLINLRSFELNLSLNNVLSQGLIILCKDIGELKSLQTLSLKFESIKTNPVHFSKAMRSLLNLKLIQQLKLNFSSNSIRDEGMFVISDLVNKFTQLKKLEIILRSSQIQDKGFGEFMRELSQKKNLKELKMNFISNQLTEKFIKTTTSSQQIQDNTNSLIKKSSIQPISCNLINLKYLDLNFSNNPNLNDSAIRILIKSFEIIKSIIKLRLIFDSINLTEKGCYYLGRLISEQPLMEDLELSLKNNDIKLTGIQYICTGLLKVKRIKRLKICIQATNIGDESANYLAICLLKMRYLTNVDLNLDNCNLTNETVENIIKTVKQFNKKAEQITINLRRNQQIRLQLYEQIKKDLQGSRIALKIDNPSMDKNYSSLLQYSKTK